MPTALARSQASTTVLAPALTDAELDRAIAHLRTLNRQAFLQYVISVGNYLVKEFFGGDFSAVHDQNPNKQRSFVELLSRRTAELKEIDLSANTLRRYMAATEVWHGLPQHVRNRLGVEVMQRLAVIPNGPDREKLAHDAAEMQWTREQAAAAVRDYKAAKVHGKRRGPKVKPDVLKKAVAVHRAVRELTRLHGAAESLGVAHRATFVNEIEAAILALGRLVAGAGV